MQIRQANEADIAEIQAIYAHHVLTGTGTFDEEQDAVRQATIAVTSIAGFCGLPEVTLPAGSVAGAPVGLSLVAGPGQDRGLLALACDAAAVLGLSV